MIGLEPLRDNSFFTHLATGRLILDSGSVPGADPYSFTAPHAPWVVQSWLASVLYAAAERLGGLDAVRLLVALMTGTLAALGWRILRPVDGLLPRFGLGGLFLVVGAGSWAERPYMIGLLAFAITALAAEGALDPRWLAPVGWIWVNSHGSFPLGVVYLVLAVAGTKLDGRQAGRETRCLVWTAGGMIAGVVGPLGLRALLFPIDLLRRQELLANVVEWQAPAFESMGQRAFILQVALAVVLLARRPTYRAALVLAAFTASALLGARNISVASLALLPAMATGAPGLGALRAHSRARLALPALVVVVGLTAVVAAERLEGPALELRAYPIDVLAYLEHTDVDLREVHMAAPEMVGNLLTIIYGAEGRRVFYDDRFDMYPAEVTEAQLALTNTDRSVFARLSDHDIDLVTVRLDHPMAVVLSSDPAWRTIFIGDRWQLSCQRGAQLGGASGSC